MRKFFITLVAVCVAGSLFAQSDSSRSINIKSTPPPSKDHFVIQLGSNSWGGKPDSIRTGGLSRTFNMYLMLDFPFKTNPKLSIAIGPGIATDHFFLDEMSADIRENASAIRFRNLADTNHFKKYKLSTAFAEAPIELRFSSNPGDNAKSIKAAVGVKVGTMLAAWVKGKSLENKSDNEINDYLFKEKSKRFFNTTRISATARLGWGHFSLFGSYALTPLFKEGNGPKVNPYSIGLTISGL